LLGLAGARIVKVESTGRPDGARFGPAVFFDLLHAGHESVALDFTVTKGRADLVRLVEAADVVIEASRPRALRQLGIDAGALLRHGRPRVWLSITGYGRTGDAAQRVAFGDDGAVAGGLVVWDDRGPCFCADAVADPLTGLVAASAALGAIAAGGRWLLDVSLQRVAAHFAPDADAAPNPAQAAVTVAPPRARRPAGVAAPLGAHTEAVLAEIRQGRR
jgi:crotonobetainyl-CoA:carnitine CoA-transferase CaiB-like acyl-CoA transferase